MFNHSVSHIVFLNTRYQHQRGCRLGTEKVLKKDVVIHLAILSYVMKQSVGSVSELTLWDQLTMFKLWVLVLPETLMRLWDV